MTLFFAVTLFCTIEQLQSATLFQEVGIASSPNPVGSGARALGMGGAFIAVADDSTAASWNPAGLIQLERPEMSIVGQGFYRREEYSSDDHPETDDTGNVNDLNLNYLSATYPFHFYKNIVVSVNYQRLYDFKRNFKYRFDMSSGGLDVGCRCRRHRWCSRCGSRCRPTPHSPNRAGPGHRCRSQPRRRSRPQRRSVRFAVDQIRLGCSCSSLASRAATGPGGYQGPSTGFISVCLAWLDPQSRISSP